MNILIIGLGSIAKKHIDSICKLTQDVKIFALRSSLNSEQHDYVENLFSYSDIPLLKLDFIMICNPTAFHYKALVKVIDYKIPIFIEKPVLHNLDNAHTILEKLEKHRTLTYVGCNLRFLDCILFMKDYLEKESNKLNEVTIYAGSYLPEWRPNIDFRTNYSAIPEQGGGVHLDLIHELDYTFWLFKYPSKVSSHLNSKSSLRIKSKDAAYYLLDYDHFTVNVSLNYFRRDYKRTAEFVFDDKTLTVDLAKNTVLDHLGKIVFKSEQTFRDTLTSQMEYFVNLIHTENPISINTFEDGLKTLKFCLHDSVK